MTPVHPIKAINYDTYLQGLALFTMANEHAKKASAFSERLSKVLDYPDLYAGCITDEIYDTTSGTPSNELFDRGLAHEKIIVTPESKSQKRKR